MVLCGIDLIDQYDDLFHGKNIGLITSPSGLSSSFESTIDIFYKKYRLKALFSPEHGVRGNLYAGSVVDTYEDPYTHVPVYSLYRKDSKRLTPDMLKDIDMVVYDIQDIGARFYTFIYTMLFAMEDCAKNGIEFTVFDRPNPLGGTVAEGNVIGEKYRSFVGAYGLCIRYALTIGEFARMANEQLHLGCKLHIVPCRGWRREMLFPDTGRIWVMPTPAIPRFESALLYPGMCLLEGTNLSEGRGTAAPFEMAGAPFLDARRLSQEMNAMDLPGVVFRPVYFIPSTDKFKDQLCEGVQIHVTDIQKVRAVETGMRLIRQIRHMYDGDFAFLPPWKEKGPMPIDRLTGDAAFREENCDLDALLQSYRSDAEKFSETTRDFYLYR